MTKNTINDSITKEEITKTLLEFQAKYHYDNIPKEVFEYGEVTKITRDGLHYKINLPKKLEDSSRVDNLNRILDENCWPTIVSISDIDSRSIYSIRYKRWEYNIIPKGVIDINNVKTYLHSRNKVNKTLTPSVIVIRFGETDATLEEGHFVKNKRMSERSIKKRRLECWSYNEDTKDRTKF